MSSSLMAPVGKRAESDINIKPESVISSGYEPIKSEETDDEDCKDTNTLSPRSHENINIKEEAVKVELKTEDDISTDDERRSSEHIISSSSVYDPVKSEETDEEDMCHQDTNTSNQPINIKEEYVKVKVKEEDEVSTDDEFGSEMKEPKRRRTSSRLQATSVQEDKRKRKREVEESNGSVQKAARIECSIEGCNRKAAGNGKCRREHGGFDYCKEDGCTKHAVNGGVCIRHKKDPMAIHIICSVEGCTRKAAGNGKCRRKHNGYDLCSQEGCTSRAKTGGVCRRHRANQKPNHRICSVEGCTGKAADSGTCRAKHKGYNHCKHDGCTKAVQKGGVCIKHGAIVKTCSHKGCTKAAQKSGVCIKHGAKVNTCKHDGCTNYARGKEGVCQRHGANSVKTCKHEGCTNGRVKKGLCRRHFTLSNGL